MTNEQAQDSTEATREVCGFRWTIEQLHRLRAGVELHDLAPMQNESRHPRHRRADWPRDTCHNYRHPDLKAAYVLAIPFFNESDWRGELLKDDKRWGFSVPARDLVRAWRAAKNNGEVLRG